MMNALTRLPLQYERNNKLTDLDVVVASIAHEIRQPLATIATNGAAARRYLKQAPPNYTEVDSCLGAMVAASMRAGEIFSSIRMLFSNASHGEQRTDLNQLAVEAVDLLRDELQANRISIKLQRTESLPPVMLHKGQLREVMINLIENAIAAMVTVSDRPRVLQITTYRHDNEAIGILVEDTGQGIAPEKVEGIFEPFFSTKASGMGVGLAICKSIVERHQGHLAVSSQMNRGTRFQLTLPIEPIEQ